MVCPVSRHRRRDRAGDVPRDSVESLHDADFINDWTTGTVDELKEHVSNLPPSGPRRLVASRQTTFVASRSSSPSRTGWHDDVQSGLVSPPQWLLQRPGDQPAQCNRWQRRQEGRLVLVAVGRARSAGHYSADAARRENLECTGRSARVPAGKCLAEDAGWRGHLLVFVAGSGEIAGLHDLQPRLAPDLAGGKSDERSAVNEDLINFHVCINCFYNETAHYADIVLPWTTYMERWDLDARGSYNLRPYVGLRTPMIEPLGESKDVREFFPELARRIGGGMEQWYQESVEEYMEQWASNVPENPETGKRGLERLLEEGAWEGEPRTVL